MCLQKCPEGGRGGLGGPQSKDFYVLVRLRPAEVAMVPRVSDLKLKVPPKHRTTKIDKKMAELAKSTNKWEMIIKKLIIMCK